MVSHPSVFLLKADLDLPDDQLRALRSTARDDAPTGEDVERAVASLLGERITVRSAVRCGTFRWVYHALLASRGEVAVRLNRVRHDLLVAGLRLERRVTERLQEHGVPVATVLGVADGNSSFPHAMSVTRWIAGSTLSERDGDEPHVTTALRSLGAFLSRVHQVPADGYGGLTDADSLEGSGTTWQGFLEHSLERHLSRLVTERVLEPSEAEAVFAAIRALAYECSSPSLLHGDPGGGNILVDEGGQVQTLLDWEDALAGDPLFDIAACAAFHPERRWSALFDGYGLQGTSEVWQRFWTYFLRIAVARTVVRQRFGLSDLPGRQPAARRIHRALAALDAMAVRP